MRTVAANWEITVYLNISIYYTHYLKIKSLQEETSSLCDETAKSFENNCNFFCFNKKFHTNDICLNFKSASEKILNEFESDTYNILKLIEGQNNLRNKRELSKNLGDIIYTLFGTISLNDITKWYSNIKNMIKNGRNSQHIVGNKMMITPASTNEAILLDKKTFEATTEVSNNIKKIRHYITSDRDNFNDENMEKIIKNQILNLETIYNQYSLELMRINQILHFAIQGKLHPLVISSAQLLEEMKTIKLNLPSNLDIPVKLDLSDMPEIFKIMQTTIVRNNDIIMFINTIPIVSSTLYNLYNIIPNPMLIENNIYMLIKPRIKYLALTIDQEYYVNLDQNELSMCYDTKHFKICKNLVTQRVTTSDDCEINLITNVKLANIENVCKFKYTSIKHGIFHKLMSANSWLYTVNQQNLIITCSNYNQIIRQIYGTGIISLSEQCSASSAGYHMIPFRTMYSDMDSDVVPNINISRYMYKTPYIKNVLPSESIFEHYEENEVVTQNDANHESIIANIGLIICTCISLILICSLSIIIIVYKRKIKNVSQPSLTEPANKETEVVLKEGKSSPKIVL